LDTNGREWQEAGEDCIMRNFITCTLHQNIIRVLQVKEDKMEGACSMHGRDE
jgi:hypothetical protein